MEHTVHKLVVMLLSFAMLLSVFAVAEDGTQAIAGADSPIEMSGETIDGTQEPAGGMEIALDAGDGLSDGIVDPEGDLDLGMNGSLTIDLDTDLEGEGLETLEAELPPQTGEATNAAGDGTQANPFQIGTWEQLNNELGSNGSQKPGEANGDPTYFKLTGDAIADSTVSTGIVVPSGRHVALDLNGKTIDRKLSSAASGGTVIKVKGDLTVMDSSSGKTGNITGGYMYGLGGGVYVGEGGMLTMSGGTISGNCAEGGGGGVYVDEDGKFTMSGGTIEENTSEVDGGGVYVYAGEFIMSGASKIIRNTATGTTGGGVYVEDGTFTLQGGTISQNTAYSGGGVYVYAGEFSMKGGMIGNNIADSRGDGVYLDISTFTMSGDSMISNNTSNVRGEGVFVSARRTGKSKFTMSGGTISTTGENDVSVYINNGAFTMEKGTVSATGKEARCVENNGTFSMSGGLVSGGNAGVRNWKVFTMTGGTVSGSDTGVFNEYTDALFTMKKGEGGTVGTITNCRDGVNNEVGSFVLSDGNITGNTGAGVVNDDVFTMSGGNITDNKGGGVRHNQTFNLSGEANISGNTIDGKARNVVIRNGLCINIAQRLENSNPIGVSFEDGITADSRDFTKDYNKFMAGSAPADYFKSEMTGYDVSLNETADEAALVKVATVTFYANGGKGEMKPQKLRPGAETELSANAFKYPGYRFTGWNTSADGSGTAYADKARVALSGDLNLYAQWRQIEVEAGFKDASVPRKGVEYTGKAIEPEVVVKDRSTKAPLTKDRDYTVAYKKNKNVGRATVTVAFIGDYSGVAKEKLYFKIEPKNLTVTAEDKVKVVGEADPELTYETEGLAEGDKLAGTLTRDKGEAPGEYAIRQGSLKAGKNYRMKFIGAKLTILKADAAVVTPPKAKAGLVETGAPQALVEAGEGAGGTMMYSLDGENWSAEVPTATKAATYVVYYKVVGDKNHNDTDVASVEVTIAAKSEPIQTPAPKPTKAPKPTVKPTATPKPTETPKPTATPAPTPRPADPDFTLLARMTVSGDSKTALKLAWTKVKGAEGYDVFFARCNRRFKLKETVGASESRAVRFNGLDRRESYKGYVRAWKRVDGKKTYIGKASPQVHAITGGYTNHECNTRSVKLNKTRLTLKAGRSAALKAKLKGVKAGMKLLDHVDKVRFYSTDANVATIDAKGNISAVAKGSCTVYAIANNGVRNSVKVKVK